MHVLLPCFLELGRVDIVAPVWGKVDVIAPVWGKVEVVAPICGVADIIAPVWGKDEEKVEVEKERNLGH